ncbi:hypothetical protein [Paraburkholderia sp. CI3]|uniref:hypothetical protein n=1 Tax=Paraburkholderia sp. CI3 TaxID=2991060 RepID=UPI003D224B1D
MKRSLSTAIHWSVDHVTDKSWLRRALPVLALLVAFDIVMNAWQSWHDFRASDALAAQRLDVQTDLIAGRIADQFRDVNAMTTAMGNLLETGTLTDAALVSLTDVFGNPLRRVLVGVFDASDGHLLAGSSPGIINAVPRVGPFLARVRANPSAAFLVPVGWGERGALVVAKGHQNRNAELDAIIIMVVTFQQLLLDGVNLAPGTAVLLRDHENRVVVRARQSPMVSVGQFVADEGTARAGPTATTEYVHSRVGIDRLVSTRKIATGLTPDYWTLVVGYRMTDYRASLWTSLYINVGRDCRHAHNAGGWHVAYQPRAPTA